MEVFFFQFNPLQWTCPFTVSSGTLCSSLMWCLCLSCYFNWNILLMNNKKTSHPWKSMSSSTSFRSSLFCFFSSREPSGSSPSFRLPNWWIRVLSVLKMRRKQKVDYAQLGNTVLFLHVSRLPLEVLWKLLCCQKRISQTMTFLPVTCVLCFHPPEH